MNICLLTRALPEHQFGGLESHTVTLAQALQQRGHTVTIITSAKPNKSETCADVTGINIVNLPRTQPGRYTLSFFRESAKFIKELDKQEHFDIIHSQGFAGFGYMFRKTKPLVVTIHGTVTSETMLFAKKFSLPNLWRYRKRLGITPLYRQLLSRADAILVDSNFSKQLLLQEEPKLHPKLAMVYLGIDTDYFLPYDKIAAKQRFGFTSDFLILALGRITESKGFQVLLEAVTHINDISYQLVIAGDGPYRRQLEHMAVKNKINHIRFLGRVDISELPWIYSAADVFVNPDLAAPAFGLVAAEALSCGTPVLASNTGALPEIVTPEVGLCVPPNDATQLAAALRTLYQNKGTRWQLAQAARKRAESLFTVHRMAVETEKVYQRLED